MPFLLHARLIPITDAELKASGDAPVDVQALLTDGREVIAHDGLISGPVAVADHCEGMGRIFRRSLTERVT